MGLAELRLFFPFPGLAWLRLLLGEPTSWLSPKCLTSPCSTMFDIRTPVREAPSATTDEATLSTSNQRSLVSLDDLRRSTTFSRHAVKSAMKELAHTPMEPLGSSAEPWRKALAEETALSSIAFLVNNLRNLARKRLYLRLFDG